MRTEPMIEVLIVEPRDRDLEALVGQCGTRTSRAASGDLATLAHPASHVPDVVVVDIRGGKEIPAGLSAVRRMHPDLAIIVVASAVDPAVLLDAMRAGASEFLTEPLSVETVKTALSRVMVNRHATTTGSVYAFLGAKGGVGTTTTAVNVATALAKAVPGRTLLIDLHLAHGDASVFLGAEPRFSVVDALENTHRFDEAFFRGLVTPTKAGPDLLASSDRALSHHAGMQDFRMVIDFAARHYAYVVLDVPRSDPAALDALDTASSIVVVANQELATVKNASRIASALRQRYGKERVRVIVSRFDKNADISAADVERVVAGNIKHLVPSDYRLALQALNSGRPLALGNHNRLAASFRELAHDLAGIEAEPERRPESTSIFGRLTGRN